MTAEEAIVALIAIAAGALLKSISGVGLPLVAVPAISYVTDIETAVAVTAIPNLMQNTTLAWTVRASRSETRDLPLMGAAGFVGAIVGTVVLVSLPEEPLIALLVVVVLAYALRFFTNPEFELDPTTARRLAPGVGLVAGGFQGAVGISGPIVASWVHSYRLPRNAHILSVTTLFAIAGIAQIPTLMLNGQMDDLWIVGFLGGGVALATVPIGSRLRDRLSSEGFDRFVVLTLTASVLGLAIRTFV